MTPMMAQWRACKDRARGALLLFRLGDFYEAFENDAEILSRELDLTLTQRQGIPMAGIPSVAAEGYIDRLIGKGYRVAVAEQVEAVGASKGLVKRDIVQVVSPGSIMQSSLLRDKQSNFIAAVAGKKGGFGLAILEVTTADFRVMECDAIQQVIDALTRLSPRELVVSETVREFLDAGGLTVAATETRDRWYFDVAAGIDRLKRHFGVHSLDGFGVAGMQMGLGAAGGLMAYMTEELQMPLHHVKAVCRVDTKSFLGMDQATQRQLELIHPLQEGGRTLLSVLDSTETAMGGRLLKEWILHPLMAVDEIRRRQERVGVYIAAGESRRAIRTLLRGVRDIERLIVRIEAGRASPRDLSALHLSLEQIPNISPLLQGEILVDVTDVRTLIEKALVDTPPLRVADGGVFRGGYCAQLDALRSIKGEGQTWLAAYQTRLREELGIKTLKVGYTPAFGYYIEVSRGQADRVPSDLRRTQTLVNAERFISEELKQFEHRVLSAEDQIVALEQSLFIELRDKVAASSVRMRELAKQIAVLDVILCCAEISQERGYVCPAMHEGRGLRIVGGRHPVVEEAVGRHAFVPNDVIVDGEREQLLVITGPNMGGKSTFIRQAALMVIMAQMGCYIPAREASMGVVDQIFTRIGASDNLSRGDSTFMVEMKETARILHGVTERSLVILDEIGRGTSTYDGIAIAWSVAEYLLTTPGKRAKTLFATHYFELAELEHTKVGVVNYTALVTDQGHEVSLLHKIVRGTATHSYGIQVAKLAGFPADVVARAVQVLEQFHARKKRSSPKLQESSRELQLELF